MKMQICYVFGLLLIFLISASNCNTLNRTDDWEVYYKSFDDADTYDDFDSDELEQKNSSNLNETNIKNSSNISDQMYTIDLTTMEIITSKSDLKDLDANSIQIKCPEICFCDEDLLYINCSSRNLKSIPKMLPTSVTELDLSNNLIENIDKNDLDYLENLQNLYLSGNSIEILEEHIFSSNKKLNIVDLARNKISQINPDIFVNLPSVSVLSLSENPINIPKEGSFLNAPHLEKLILTNCSINEIYDDTFKNLSGLIQLKLDKNDFHKKINTQAFNASMQNLVKLTLPELEQNYIVELCQILESVDNISFKNFDLSCYEIIAEELPFNESTILGGTKNSVFTSTQNKETTTRVNNYKQRVKETSKSLNMTTENNVVPNESSDGKAVEVPAEIINYCLFAIMGIAVVGLVVGIICRKDIYGIKTKLCRTKKARGPAKNDLVKPGEEIPLNKV